MDLKKLRFLKDLNKGLYIKLFKNWVNVICHLCQKSIMDVAFNGMLKFFGKKILNIIADPVAIST